MRHSDEGSAIGSLVSPIACSQYWMYSICAELNMSLFSPFGRVPKFCKTSVWENGMNEGRRTEIDFKPAVVVSKRMLGIYD